MRKYGRLRYLPVIAVFTVMNLAFQACTNNNSFLSLGRSSEQSGESYTGKPEYYNFDDAGEVCTQKTAAGRPFPTRQIFLQEGHFALVREHCNDIAPVPLDASEYTYDFVTDTLTYQGQSFQPKADLSEYATLPLICPSGQHVTNTSPANVFLDPLNLTTDPWMNTHPQIPAALDGSISALPRYRVEVTTTDPAYQQDWMRVGQQPVIATNTLYAVSFLLQKGTVDRAILYYDEGTPAAAVGVNLATGVIESIVAEGGLATPTADLRPYGNGYLFTAFIRSSSAGSSVQPDTGVAPWHGNPSVHTVQLGDSIYATAAGFRRVSSYCSP